LISIEWWLALAVIATLMSVAAPLKIWNNTRIEMNLSGTSSCC